MAPDLTLSVSRDPETLLAARRLRHLVFVEEMGAAPGRDGLEGDDLDGSCGHLVLRDAARPGAGVIGTVRLAEGARYTAREFDLSRLAATGLRLAEVGRACLHPEYRGGLAGIVLLRGMLDTVRKMGAEVALGTASFPGSDPAPHMPALRRLRMEAPAPAGIAPVAHGPEAVAITGAAPRAAMAGVPALIKTYIRAGATVGEGAWMDRAFNSVDVCMLLRLGEGSTR